MNRGLLIGGGLLLGGGALYLATRGRGVLEGAVESVYDTAGRMMTTPPPTLVQVVDEAARKVAVRVARMGIADEVLQNFRTYNVAALIEQTRGSFPWALAAAMVEIESGGDAGIYNYYPNGVGTPPKKVGYWRAGQPLPDGTNGQPNAWAAGLCQIIRKYPRDLSLAERFDPLKSLQKMMPEWRAFYSRASKAALVGPALWAAVYFGHNQGGPNLSSGLAKAPGTFEAVVKASALATKKPAQAAAALGVALHVAARVPLWLAVEQSLKAGA